MTDLSTILAEREKTHGRFADVAAVYTALKDALSFDEDDKKLKPVHETAIDMILMKVARIRCGDEDSDEHWEDLVGYPSLVLRDHETRRQHGRAAAELRAYLNRQFGTDADVTRMGGE